MLAPSRESSAATLANLGLESTLPADDKFIDDRLVFGLQPVRARVPDGWSAYVHPAGWIYFVNPLRVVTDDDIRDPEVLSALSSQFSFLPELPAGCEVHVHAKSLLRTYVNHTLALGGWDPEAVDGSRIDSMDASSLLRLRRMYWAYLVSGLAAGGNAPTHLPERHLTSQSCAQQQHPCHAPLPPGAEDDLAEALTTFRTGTADLRGLSACAR